MPIQSLGRWPLRIYLDLVMVLNFWVDLLLLVGTNRLAGHPGGWGRCALGAVLGGLYGGLCLIPGFRFLGDLLWRLVFLGLMGILAFGLGRSASRRCVLFALLSFALGGVAYAMGSGDFLQLCLAAGGLCALCLFGFRGRAEGREFVPVELAHGARRVRLKALVDSGNLLRDPVSGDPVLIVGAATALALLDLDPAQLGDPVGTLAGGNYPGLRLIPYRAVGRQGMLLGYRFSEAKVGGKARSLVVAFTAQGLERAGEEFEGLIGGSL